MKRFTNKLVSILFVASAAMHGQATRTWVSGVGDDVNPCSRTAPCKTFAGAISKTAAGGEISALDPGGFGAVTITKAITINGAGTLAGILNAGNNGIVISAAATDVVVLKNISINGSGTGLNGIRYVGGKRLEVYDSTIERVTLHGIDVSKTSAGELFLSNVKISATGSNGVNLNTTVGSSTATIVNSTFIGNANGIRIQNGSKMIVKNCSIANATAAGISVESGALPSEALLDSNTITGGANGVQAGPGGALVRMSGNSITAASPNGLLLNGGTILSFNDNKIAGNSLDGNPTALTAFK